MCNYVVMTPRTDTHRPEVDNTKIVIFNVLTGYVAHVIDKDGNDNPHDLHGLDFHRGCSQSDYE